MIIPDENELLGKKVSEILNDIAKAPNFDALGAIVWLTIWCLKNSVPIPKDILEKWQEGNLSQIDFSLAGLRIGQAKQKDPNILGRVG